MLQKDKFITTFSKSTTNSPSRKPRKLPESIPGSPQDTLVQFVKGVGPKLGTIFANRDIQTVRDLFNFFPRTYEDRTRVQKISDLTEGARATLSVRVQSQRMIPIAKFGKSLLEVRCANESGTLSLKWFHPPRGIEKRFQPGIQVGVSGKVKFYQGRPEIVHPEITWGVSSDLGEDGPHHHSFGRMVPVYVEIEGVTSRTLRNILWQALESFGGTLPEELPDNLLQKWSLPRLAPSVRALHFPPEEAAYSLEKLVSFRTPAHERLIYGEFFKFEYLMLRKRLQTTRVNALSFGRREGRDQMESLAKSLPFRLTGDQKRAVEDIFKDLLQPHPMSRLVQGDVGSGKTVVAFLTAAAVIAEGGQVALMVPTEILAEQHFRSCQSLFQGKLPAALLTGKSTGPERSQIQKRLGSGEPMILIGTHALLEDPVQFQCLDYVLIDEQHRFGVDQRRTLKSKGIRTLANGTQVHPHSLILSATPIPRTLAMTAFGDLVVTLIREMPPGRSPVITKVVRDKTQRAKAYLQIQNELKSGRQAYFIYPLVSDSEAEGFTQLKSAIAEAENLATEVFPEFRVGLLHGQMKNDEKVATMERFKKGEIQVLVSTTVVEVGVDVPNSTVMVIEHAERFGLSQLHQLRGRVGRGSLQSYCYLFTTAKEEGPTSTRLEVLEETQDGFKIAEADLEIRGPGEFLGTRQSGGLPFKVANLVRDAEWLIRAREDAIQILKEDPELKDTKNSALRQYFVREGGRAGERLFTF
ncbi:MAG: ATP-dependent DNA helicase RecG [Bdellovibrio sp.]|nr:ATP-dependent DNA helicase RecG [Bdellovibrio sp.]